MGIAYAWEKMATALDALAIAPEALPERLKHALFPHFMSALHDAEMVHYLPPELLESMRAVRERLVSSTEDHRGLDTAHAKLSNMSLEDAEALAKEIVDIAREIRRLSTF